MKRILLLLPLVLLLAGCTPSNEEYYQRAQLYLGAGDHAAASSLFTQLGEYADSADYALYAAGLEALHRGDLSLAQANMAQVDPFKSSGRYLQFIRALILEREGDLEGALAVYQNLGSFSDSHLAVQRLTAAIPERDLAHAKSLMAASRWQQALALLTPLNGYGDSATLAAQCRDAIGREAYDGALRLYQRGEYEQAMAAFDALGDTMDAKARSLMCRDAMYQQLEKDYRQADMASAASLMARYEEMEDYLESSNRLSALRSRFSTNLQLLSAVYARPYVRFGGNGALTWRAIKAEGAKLTLLSQDILFFSTQTDLAAPFTPAETAAILTFNYPQLTLDLNAYAFTQGTGSQTHPFQ